MRTIRRMKPEDLIQVCAIEEAIFTEPWSQDSFERALVREQNLYLVCECGTKIEGYCGLWGVAGEGQITNVAVKESARRQGIGRLMLLALLEEGRKAGLTAYTLEVRVSNEAAIRLYHSLGFRDSGIRPDFYELPREDALIMWRMEQDEAGDQQFPL